MLCLSRYNEELRRKRVIKIQPSQSKQDEVTKAAEKLEPVETEEDSAKRGGDVTEEIGQVAKRYGHFPRFGLFSTSFSSLYRTSIFVFLTTYLLQEDNLEKTPKKMNDKGKIITNIIFILVLALSKGL